MCKDVLVVQVVNTNGLGIALPFIPNFSVRLLYLTNFCSDKSNMCCDKMKTVRRYISF